MNRFAEMTTFVEVVEAGSLSAAADQLGIAVSAVSRRIRELETRLGVRLANRSTRGLSTTPLGQAYYERCVQLLAELENTEALITKNVDTLHGRSRFSIPLELGKQFMMPILFKFAQKHPDAILDIDLSDRAVDLIAEGFDFAIRIGHQQDANLNSIRIGKMSYSVAASPSFWEQYGYPASPEDMTGLPVLAYRLAMPQGKLFYESQNAQNNYVQLKPRFLSNNGVCLIEAAIAGLGICLEPDFMLTTAVNAGQLEPVLTDYTWFKREIYAAYPKGRPLPILAQRLLDQIVLELGQSAVFNM
ncbi:LysR family transcriptional regulator [Endozoicomonas sp. SM1973]|uniref:LysR family transcriptional regulator n=1 Tax=Spartinivicinus marinus TaxID=2994442 RepID=A0A853I429_9GAMM|nr:LysR family transcriptional regulator [Spartinivicinus marinus]MCX4028487.1 LysR family transcriptional regulator [Spartinivicinus marinus]NYZ67399.1 LysR family transcriptional regulator [Spartinivicinus marinus]